MYEHVLGLFYPSGGACPVVKSDLPAGRNWGLELLVNCGSDGVKFGVVNRSASGNQMRMGMMT